MAIKTQERKLLKIEEQLEKLKEEKKKQLNKIKEQERKRKNQIAINIGKTLLKEWEIEDEETANFIIEKFKSEAQALIKELNPSVGSSEGSQE